MSVVNPVILHENAVRAVVLEVWGTDVIVALALDAAVVQFMGVGVIAHMGDGPHADLATAGHLLIAALTGINLHYWVVFWQRLNAGGENVQEESKG